MKTMWSWFAVLALGISACGNPNDRLRPDRETFRALIDTAVGDLLQRRSAQRTGSDRLRIAFLGVENKSMEELVDWRDTVRQQIDTAVNKSGRYRNISDRFVAAALREDGLRADELFVPEKRRMFLKTLEANGSPVEFLLHASLNSGTSGQGRSAQRDYVLTLELVDIETGEAEKVNATVRKD